MEVGWKDGRQMEPVQNHLGITNAEPSVSHSRKVVEVHTELLITATYSIPT
jgi:hypothetical protein